MSIVVHKLCRNFGPNRAVDDASFEIGPGQIVGLIGPNGAGKTTILRILAAFLAPTSGSVSVAGHDVQTQADKARRSLGYLPETPPGYDHARVAEYLDYRARLKEIPRRWRALEIDRCLSCCDLSPVKRRLLGRLSQGFRRRVGLADALLGSPPVLILDEPTIGLDPLQVKNTRDLLQELAPRTTVVVSTHLLAEAQTLCGRVLMLLKGRLVSDVATSGLAPGLTFEIEVRGHWEIIARWWDNRPGVQTAWRVASDDDWHTVRVTTAAGDLRERLLRDCLQEGFAVRELRSVAETLEEHFVRIMQISRQKAA